MWFIADDWQIPNQFFDEYIWSIEKDHNWHEFDGIEKTNEEVTVENSIDGFLSYIVKRKLPW